MFTLCYVNVAKIYHEVNIFKTGVGGLEGGSIWRSPHNFISLKPQKIIWPWIWLSQWFIMQYLWLYSILFIGYLF